MIYRIVPNLKVADAGENHDFYTDFLGLEKAFDLGWVASFRSPENRSIQVSLVSGDASAPEDSAISVVNVVGHPN
jgi:catechol 2,3-dioxygenase-like lactoylglutathione lyase family enzyme